MRLMPWLRRVAMALGRAGLVRLAVWCRRAVASWRGLAVPLALLACLLSVAALFGPAARSASPPAPPGIEQRLSLVGAELLLPHLLRGAPFPRAQSVAMVLAADDPEMVEALRPLGPVALAGAPSLRSLVESFAPAAEAAVLAEAGIEPAGTLAAVAARAMRFGAALGVGGTSALDATGVAETALARGDLAAAMAALEALDGPPAAALAPWREAAARRMVADSAAALLSRLVAARVGAGP
jgi:hypothetical protein